MKIIRQGPYRTILCMEDSYIEEGMVHNAIICFWNNKDGWIVREWCMRYPLSTRYEIEDVPSVWQAFIRCELLGVFYGNN